MQRPPPESDSDIWSFESSGLLTLCKKTSGFQDSSPLNSLLFSQSFDWCAANHSWKSLQLLSWIFPAWCNVLMILSVVWRVRWHSKQKKYPPLEKVDLCVFSGRSFMLHIPQDPLNPQNRTLCAFDMRENVWFSLFSSSRPHKMLMEVRLADPISASISGAKNA